MRARLRGAGLLHRLGRGVPLEVNPRSRDDVSHDGFAPFKTHSNCRAAFLWSTAALQDDSLDGLNEAGEVSIEVRRSGATKSLL